MSIETVEALKAARALIDTPEKWTKGATARGKSGCEVDHHGKSAVCFCIEGALFRTKSFFGFVFEVLQKELPKGFPFLFGFNDDPSTTHADVMALFDRAIARAEREA